MVFSSSLRMSRLTQGGPSLPPGSNVFSPTRCYASFRLWPGHTDVHGAFVNVPYPAGTHHDASV